MLLAEYSIKGLDSKGLNKVVPSLKWESQSEILFLRLPKIYNDVLVDYQKKIETEVVIEGTIVTPKEVIEADITKMIESKQGIVDKYYSGIFLLLDQLFGKASASENISEIEKILTVELVCLRRSIVNNRANLCEAQIDKVMKHYLAGYPFLIKDASRIDVFKEIKLAYLNSVKAGAIVLQPKFFDVLSQTVAMESLVAKNSFYPKALQGLMVSCSLAYLHSEFYQDKAIFNSVIETLLKHYDPAKLADLFEILLTNFELSNATLEYHHWFKDILIGISNLPLIADHSFGGRGAVFVHQHPSDFIKNSGDFLGIKECAQQVVKELRKRGGKR